MKITAAINKKLFIYMFRWQLSTPILAAAVLIVPGNTATKVIASNLIGSLIFFPIDKWIMTKNKPATPNIHDKQTKKTDHG